MVANKAQSPKSSSTFDSPFWTVCHKTLYHSYLSELSLVLLQEMLSILKWLHLRPCDRKNVPLEPLVQRRGIRYDRDGEPFSYDEDEDETEYDSDGEPIEHDFYF